MSNEQEFDYVAYVGFATSNPGPGARCVLVTQGEKRHAATERFSTKDDESIDDVIVNALGYALRVLEKRADKRVRIVCNSKHAIERVPSDHARGDSAAVDAVRAVLRERASWQLYWSCVDTRLDEAADLAWKAAFGRAATP